MVEKHINKLNIDCENRKYVFMKKDDDNSLPWLSAFIIFLKLKIYVTSIILKL